MSYTEDRTGDSNTVKKGVVAGLQLFLTVCARLCVWVKPQMQLYFGNTGIWSLIAGESDGEGKGNAGEFHCNKQQMTSNKFYILHPVLHVTSFIARQYWDWPTLETKHENLLLQHYYICIYKNLNKKNECFKATCLIIFEFNLCLKEINFKPAILKRNKKYHHRITTGIWMPEIHNSLNDIFI